MRAAGAARAQRALATSPGSGRAPIVRARTLPNADDLAADAHIASRERKPIVLFFDRAECPYCERALREHLVPISENEWRGRAIFRQIEIDEPRAVVGFDGKATTHRDVAARYGVRLSPTVIVVDGRGEPLAEPVVGLMPDFYAAYLENALDAATRTLTR